MPTRFAQQFKRTAVSNLLQQFGEQIQYHAGRAAGRGMTAIVVRDPAAILAEVGEVLTQALILRVENDPVRGIDANSIDTGLDKVEVALVADGPTEFRSIVRVLSDANGFLRILVQ